MPIGRTLNGHEAGNGGHSQGDAPTFAHCPFRATGGQGVHREMESERFEENYRAVAEAARPWRTGRPNVGTGRACSMVPKALLIHPRYQGVCGRHGREDLDVTPGDLVGFLEGIRISAPYKLKGEVGHDVWREVGRPNSTSSDVKAS